MSADASKVAVALTGAVYRAPLATAAPTSQSSSLNVAFVDLGYISEDGVTQTTPITGDVTSIPAWQNGQIVRTIRTASDDPVTFSFVALETNKTVVESWAGATVTQTVTEGSYVLNASATRTHYEWVIDIIDGSELERTYVPDGVIAEIGDKVYRNGEPVGYEMTLQADYNSAVGGNAKVWSTRLKS